MRFCCVEFKPLQKIRKILLTHGILKRYCILSNNSIPQHILPLVFDIQNKEIKLNITFNWSLEISLTSYGDNYLVSSDPVISLHIGPPSLRQLNLTMDIFALTVNVSKTENRFCRLCLVVTVC